ncbi:MAG: FAD-dependent pyridine nucleotide-disulfide oxidoreductase, partial [Solirubrobacterales bacterium]|nr:FAD-dependent pyridine nucleotide-disulfide oxidoreductase [Solirubrobacterales bacterium]
MPETPDFPLAIVGTGFAGLGMAIRLKARGDHDFVVLERDSDVGGTWRDNTYPGCQCDIPSHLYSFSFAPNPDWSRLFPTQPEIWDYLRGCADRYGVRPHIRFDHAVEQATWDAGHGFWRIATSQGEITARVVVSGQGGLSEPQLPNIPGIESFEGAMFHSARWDHDHDLRGERVAVIGTGASSIQFIPKIQPEVGKLTLFQRTPPWIMPHPDRAVKRWEKWLFRHVPITQKLFRAGIYTFFESRVFPFTRKPDLMKAGEKIALRHMRKLIPDDAELRAKLTPGYRMGCKRILMSNTYYGALAQPNADVVTDAIAEIGADFIRTADGTRHEVDTIILGTGFYVADMPFTEWVRGRDGRTMAEVFDGSPQAYLGTTVAGFPNLFLLTGPNTGLGHNSIVYILESQFNYVLDALAQMRSRGIGSLEVKPEAQRRFNEKVQKAMEDTVWTTGGCASWYIDRNGLNTTLWPGWTWDFRRRTRHFDPAPYV